MTVHLFSDFLFVNKVKVIIQKVKNYKLDGTWKLGKKPFVTILDEEVHKMTNLRTRTINTEGTYKQADTLLDVTFRTGYLYNLQPIDSKVYVRIGTEGKGFKITNNKIFQFSIKEGDVVYIYTPYGNAEINLDESVAE